MMKKSEREAIRRRYSVENSMFEIENTKELVTWDLPAVCRGGLFLWILIVMLAVILRLF